MTDNYSFSYRNIGRILLLALVLSSVLAIVHFSGLKEYLHPDKIPLLQEKLAALPEFMGRLLFIAGGALVIVCGLGRSAVSLVSGVLYGPVWGAVYSVLAALSGSIVIFAFFRLLGRPLFLDRISGYVEKADKLVARNGFLAVILIRQLPLACLLVNILLALTRVSLVEFVCGSVVGFLPEAIVFALYGSSAQSGFFSKVAIASILLVVVVIGMKFLSQKLNREEI